MTFGEALMQIMGEKGMSVTELAAKSGVRKQTITELIKGRTSSKPHQPLHIALTCMFTAGTAPNRSESQPFGTR